MFALSNPFARALATAIVLHIAVFAALAHWASRRPTPPAIISVRSPTWITTLDPWVEVDGSPTSSLPSTSETRYSPSNPNNPLDSSTPRAMVRPHRSAHAGPAESKDDGGGEMGLGREDYGHGSIPNEPNGLEPSDGVGRGGERRKPIELGLRRDLTHLWTQPEHGPPKASGSGSTTGGLQEALDAHDQKIGLGFGGPILSAFHAVASSEIAPRSGAATFEAIIDASGRVAEVLVLSGDNDLRAWTALARAVHASLRSRVLRAPRKKGVAVVVDVRIEHRLPSGALPDKRMDVNSGAVAFDLADVGARAVRQVSVRILSEYRL
ncbi:MAG TPA: hypothetical protein PKL73_08950 [Polyangiaceae bacterium]|nr:MAG: hypothetical protein BWY17_03704 [Deltaproteobacteria bacterium ADurb.Bin207]HNS97062.1 hypothetical protein [Polyangiaceae bacterium]HNZ23438.1 hypothetical protein [Polyangiaceae bacterium]HOD23732.1 hypothetical protein [Polyangiaceae bacterium]HOE49978.1 hypothetical protein [Polyangiaceae bacterium]